MASARGETPTPGCKMYKSDFDFGSNLDPDDTQVGTIQALLVEINHEATMSTKGVLSDPSGKRLTIEALDSTLSFIETATGRRYRSEVESLPINVLKTIKLLYALNDSSDTHFFRRIQSPLHGGDATMEFRITGSSSRNKYTADLVNALLSQLRLGIDETKLRQIEASLLTNSKLLSCIAIENQELIKPIHATFARNSEFITHVYKHLTGAVSNYVPARLACSTPLHEALYTYLRSLPFLHFTGEYPAILELAKIEPPVSPIHREIARFCEDLSSRHGEDIQPDTEYLAIDDTPAFIEENSVAIGKLIKAATGIHSEKRDLTRDDVADFTRKVLAAFVLHKQGAAPTHKIAISVMDCIAALCVVRHQQKGDPMTTYSPFWVGQKSGESKDRLLGHLDKNRSIEELHGDDYIPFGALQILYSRFCEFHAAFTGDLDHHQAWMGLQAVRFAKYAECFRSNDINQIDLSIEAFNVFCQSQVTLLLDRVNQRIFSNAVNSWLDEGRS